MTEKAGCRVDDESQENVAACPESLDDSDRLPTRVAKDEAGRTSKLQRLLVGDMIPRASGAAAPACEASYLLFRVHPRIQPVNSGWVL
jgi:hypothetical protein